VYEVLSNVNVVEERIDSAGMETQKLQRRLSTDSGVTRRQ